jgi:hypothetical protein
MRLRLAAQMAAICLLLLLTGQAPAERVYRATVQIRPHTPNGDLVTDFFVKLKLLNRPGDTPVSVHYLGAAIEKSDFSVETGDYLLEVNAPGFQSSRELLGVYQPRVLRTILLRLGYEFDEYSLSGHVRGYPGSLGKVRIHLTSLYGNVLRESTVDRDGSFYFPAQRGPFLLLAIADEPAGPAILESMPIVIKGKEVVTLDLSGKAGHAAK